MMVVEDWVVVGSGFKDGIGGIGGEGRRRRNRRGDGQSWKVELVVVVVEVVMGERRKKMEMG